MEVSRTASEPQVETQSTSSTRPFPVATQVSRTNLKERVISKLIPIITILLVIAIGIGILIGYFAIARRSMTAGTSDRYGVCILDGKFFGYRFFAKDYEGGTDLTTDGDITAFGIGFTIRSDVSCDTFPRVAAKDPDVPLSQCVEADELGSRRCHLPVPLYHNSTVIIYLRAGYRNLTCCQVKRIP